MYGLTRPGFSFLSFHQKIGQRLPGVQVERICGSMTQRTRPASAGVEGVAITGPVHMPPVAYTGNSSPLYTSLQIWQAS